MRIGLATQHLSSLGGSATYLVTVAEQLERLGHDTTILALETGEMAEVAQARGVRVVTDAAELGAPDALVAQDALSALSVARLGAQAPLLFVCHGTALDVMGPPQAPDVVSRVVAMNERVRARVSALAAGHEVVRLRQPIDMARFLPRGAPRSRARRVLLLGNNLQGARRRMVDEVCDELGLELVQVGRHGHADASPERAIRAADVVIGYGRSVLEAMACGRPAYVYDHLGGDGWVTPDSFTALEADGFGGRATDTVVDRARLRDDLAAYDPDMGILNRDLVVHAHDAGRHAEALLAELSTAGVKPAADVPLDEVERLVRLAAQADARAGLAVAELEWVEERARNESLLLWERVDRAEAQVEELKRSRKYRLGAALVRPLDRLRGRRQ